MLFVAYSLVSAENIFVDIPVEMMIEIINHVPSDTTSIDSWLQAAKNLSLLNKQFYAYMTNINCLAAFANQSGQTYSNIHDCSDLVRKLYFDCLLLPLEDINGIKLNLCNWIQKMDQNFDNRMLFMKKSGLSPEAAMKTNKYENIIGVKCKNGEKTQESYLYKTDFCDYLFYHNSDVKPIGTIWAWGSIKQSVELKKPLLTFQPGSVDQSLSNLSETMHTSQHFFNTLSTLNFPNFICDSKEYNFYIMGWIKTGKINQITLYIDYCHLDSKESLPNPFSRSISHTDRNNCLKKYIGSIKGMLEKEIKNKRKTIINICFGNCYISSILEPLKKICGEIFCNSQFKLQKIDHELRGNISDFDAANTALWNIKCLLKNNDYSIDTVLPLLHYLEKNMFVPNISELYCGYFFSTRGHLSKNLLKLYLLLNDCFQKNNCTVTKLLQFILIHLSPNRFLQQNSEVPFDFYDNGISDSFETHWKFIMTAEEQKRIDTITQENNMDKLIKLLQDTFALAMETIQKSNNFVFSELKKNKKNTTKDYKQLTDQQKIISKCCSVFFNVLSLTLQHFEMILRKKKQNDYANTVRCCRINLINMIKIDYSNPTILLKFHSNAAKDVQTIVKMEKRIGWKIKNIQQYDYQNKNFVQNCLEEQQNQEKIISDILPKNNNQNIYEHILETLEKENSTNAQNNTTNSQITRKDHTFFSSFLKACVCVGAVSLLYYCIRPRYLRNPV